MDGNPAAVGDVGIESVNAAQVVLMSISASGNWYCLKDVASPPANAGTFYGLGTDNATALADCLHTTPVGAKW